MHRPDLSDLKPSPGTPFGDSFLLFDCPITDGRGFRHEAKRKVAEADDNDKTAGARKSSATSSATAGVGDWRSNGSKWNTVILRNLPGAWHGLSAASVDWEGEVGSIYSKNTSLNSLGTMDSGKTRTPFLMELRRLMGTFGSVKNLDVVVDEDQDQNQNFLNPPPQRDGDLRPNSPMLDRFIGSRTRDLGSPGAPGGQGFLGPGEAFPKEDAGGENDGEVDGEVDGEDYGEDDEEGGVNALDLFGGGGDGGDGGGGEGDGGDMGELVGANVLEAMEELPGMDGVVEERQDEVGGCGSGEKGEVEEKEEEEKKEGEEEEEEEEEEETKAETVGPLDGRGGSSTLGELTKDRPLPATPSGSPSPFSAARGRPPRPLTATPTQPKTEPPAPATAPNGGRPLELRTDRKIAPLPPHLRGVKFDVLVQFKASVAFGNAMKSLTGKIMAKGIVMSDLDLFAINLDVDFDTSGYFSASRMDYRERQERDRQKKLLKEQLVKQKGEKQCGKKARDAIRKCDRIIEDLLLDIQAVTDNEMVMRHRPTSVAAAGASAAIEAAQSVLSNTKCSLLPTTDQELKSCLSSLKKAINLSRGCCKQCVDMSDKVIIEKTMSLPTFEKALSANGCSLFYQRCLESGYNAKNLEGCTILVPVDDAFLGEGTSTFDEECFDVHIIDGPYMCGDMLTLNGGYTQPRSENNKHAIRTRMDLGGVFTFWLAGDSEPRRKLSAIKADECCKGAIVMHIVDKILYGDDCS